MKDLRLFSWNINGIRSAIKKNALQDFLAQETPDILCLQEVKAKPEQIDFDFSGYKVFWNPAQRLGYSGTAILVSNNCNAYQEPYQYQLDESYELAIKEGRIIILDLGEFYLVNVYTPNSKPDLSRLKLREEDWDPNFLKLLKELEKTKAVVVCGDFNAAHTEIDLARPKANHKNAGFTDEERRGVDNLLKAGFIDTFRTLNPHSQRYTRWSHWGHARENNVGWRIDYFLISKSLKKNLKQAEIYENVKGSDHCPVSIKLEF